MVRALPEVGKHLLGRTRSCEEKSRSAEMTSILRLPEASNRSLEEGYLYWYHKSIILQKNIMQYLCKQSSQYMVILGMVIQHWSCVKWDYFNVAKNHARVGGILSPCPDRLVASEPPVRGWVYGWIKSELYDPFWLLNLAPELSLN